MFWDFPPNFCNTRGIKQFWKCCYFENMQVKGKHSNATFHSLLIAYPVKIIRAGAWF